MPEKVLRLESIVGAEAMEYKWPLTIGKGSLRGAEDEHDQASEIVESIKWVGSEYKEISDAMGDLLNSYDRHDWTCMNRLVTTFNNTVKKIRERDKKKENQRPSRQMLRHILQQVYNTAISDPNELNHYEPFTPEVYGETSFELINQMIDQISPINTDNKFLDLGSGVGQVVLQVAALTECQLCVGIEKAIIPSGRAVEMDSLFRKWMAWYGKKYSPYKLYQGDFLTPEHRKTISESTIVFVNNYAFGPEVDHMLKERFADLKDGARIVSSKPFCPLNFRITERNLSDIGTIMHVSVMDPLQGSVSWTDKPVSYYLHLIDSTKLERYFTKQQSHHTIRSRRTGHSLLDMDSGSNGSRSRASSLEKEADSPLLSSGSGEDSDAVAGKKGRGSRGGSRGSKKKFTKKKSTPRVDGRLSKVQNMLKSLEGTEMELETTPDTSVPPSRGESPPNSDSPDTGGSAGSGRPVREAVINAAAITEAQNDIYNNIGKRTTKMRGRGKYKHLNEGERLPRQTKATTTNNKKAVTKKGAVSGLDELDAMHQETMTKINEYNESAVLPFGCTTEKLNILPPDQIFHEEVPYHIQTGEDKIPHGLHMLLETMKKQYLAMIQTMQSKQYSDNIIKEIEREKAKKESLQKRIKQLETQIDGLIKDSLKLLKARISRLGVETESPLEFIKHANTIVSSHSQLLEKRDGLEDEIKRLEQEQKELVERKEKELLEQLISQRSGGDVNLSELRSYVQREIWNCLESRSSSTTIQPVLEITRTTVHTVNSCNSTQDTPMTTSTGGPLPKLSSEVTLTKVGAPEKLKDKDKDNSFTLPRMELKLPGENSYSYAEERRSDHQERSHVMDGRNGGKSSSLGLSDDYEDRVKMIITSELAKEGDKKMSPVKDAKMMQDHGRRTVQNGPSPTSRGRIDSDPRYPSDYRSSAGSGGVDYRYGSSGLPPDSRYRSSGGMTIGVPHDLRRTPSDPRLISPHSGISPVDSRLISPHDRRLISPHHSSMPADGRLISPHSSEPHHPSSSSYSSSRRSAPSPLDVRAGGAGSGPPPPRSSYMDRPYLESNSVEVTRVSDPNSKHLSSQDLIDMSVERALANSHNIPSSVSSSIGPGGASQQGSRMSLVIEESIRKEKEAAEKQRMVYSAVVKSDSMMEGLAIPRGGGGGTGPNQHNSRPNSLDRKPGPVLPQVEGLAARFDSYLEKTKDKPGSRGSANTSGSHNTSGEGLGARFSSPDMPPNAERGGPFSSRPPSTGSKSSLHTPDLADVPPPTGGGIGSNLDKKRVGSPLLSPVSTKSARLDEEGGSSNSSVGGGLGKKRDSEEAKRWQDEISIGFDRLVAMASEVDKRRKSTENSPAHGSPRKESGKGSGSDIRMLQDSNPFDQQTLAMKFKAGLMQGGDPGGMKGKDGMGRGVDYGSAYPPNSKSAEQNLPGENLPEHHFKKKYFNQEYQRQQLEERARDSVNQQLSRDRYPPSSTAISYSNKPPVSISGMPGLPPGARSNMGPDMSGYPPPRGSMPPTSSSAGSGDMYGGPRDSLGGPPSGAYGGRGLPPPGMRGGPGDMYRDARMSGGPGHPGSMDLRGPPGGPDNGLQRGPSGGPDSLHRGPSGGPDSGMNRGPPGGPDSLYRGPPGGPDNLQRGPPGGPDSLQRGPPGGPDSLQRGPPGMPDSAMLQGRPGGPDSGMLRGPPGGPDSAMLRGPPGGPDSGMLRGPPDGGMSRGPYPDSRTGPGPAGRSKDFDDVRGDYRRFDSGPGGPGGDRWTQNGPPPPGSGPSGGGPPPRTGGPYDQRMEMERRRWEDQQVRSMDRRGLDPSGRNMDGSGGPPGRGMHPGDAREQMQQQVNREIQEQRAAMFEGRGNPRMMVPPSSSSNDSRQLYQGYGGGRDFDPRGGRPPGPRMPMGPDSASQVGPRDRDPQGMPGRNPGGPDGGMSGGPPQGRGPPGPPGPPGGPPGPGGPGGPQVRGPHPPQGYYNQQMMQAMSYRHQMMYGGGGGPGGPPGAGGGGPPPRKNN